METVACNLCGSKDTRTLYTLPDYQLGRTDVTARFVKCNSCGLIYQNPRPTIEEMMAHYPKEYESYAPEPDRQGSWLLRRAIRYGIAKRAEMISKHKRGGRLLDVGCATGTFLRGMKENGNWEMYGLEVNAYAGEIAKGYGLDIRVGTLEQAAFPDDFFDAVTMWDVLEHLHDPAMSLLEIHRILAPGGILVLRVPNANSWDARLFGRYWAGFEPPRHLYVFSPSTLSAMLNKANLQSKEWSSNNAAYTTFLLSLRFWASSQKKKNKTREWLIQAFYHPVMRLLSAPLFYLRGLGMRGPLMIVTTAKYF